MFVRVMVLWVPKNHKGEILVKIRVSLLSKKPRKRNVSWDYGALVFQKPQKRNVS